jgi:hypothetical protein
MDDPDFRPPYTVLDCPNCGAKAQWKSPARRYSAGAWELDFECPNGHRIEAFVKLKSAPHGSS